MDRLYRTWDVVAEQWREWRPNLILRTWDSIADTIDAAVFRQPQRTAVVAMSLALMAILASR